jgi:hypothetical protein
LPAVEFGRVNYEAYRIGAPIDIYDRTVRPYFWKAAEFFEQNEWRVFWPYPFADPAKRHVKFEIRANRGGSMQAKPGKATWLAYGPLSNLIPDYASPFEASAVAGNKEKERKYG